MAIRLQQAGLRDFVVLERAGDVGGTWQPNAYPGCQCDVPSNLYSFSFAPKHDWTHAYPEQPQIQGYLPECAERFGILDRTSLGCEVREATWLEAERRWPIETSAGTLTARVLVAAPGLLSEPSVPLVPGLDRFAGKLFHTAAWDHAHDLTGERVALVGTGATAIQVGPRIRPRLAFLPGPGATDRAELEADLRRRLMLIYHPLGTCRMSDHGEDAVVDSELRVHGLQGLRVVDASVIPSSPAATRTRPRSWSPSAPPT